MAQEFSIGDVVRLRSGGPVMTITGIYPHEQNNVRQYTCTWFTSESASEASKDHFPSLALERTDTITVDIQNDAGFMEDDDESLDSLLDKIK